MNRKLGGFLLGKSSDGHMANNSPLYSKSVEFGNATVADSVGDTFQSRYIPQQTPLGISQYSISPVYPHKQIMDYQRYRNGLSKDTLLKIDQLKRLLNRYPQFFPNPNQILTWTINWAFNGDNKILDENLEQLRYIDNLAKSRHFIER
jgi:hypothetical protein